VIVTEMPIEVLVVGLGLKSLIHDLRNRTGRAKAEDTEEASTRAHHSPFPAERTLARRTPDSMIATNARSGSQLTVNDQSTVPVKPLRVLRKHATETNANAQTHRRRSLAHCPFESAYQQLTQSSYIKHTMHE
jgi:hypothetical protein